MTELLSSNFKGFLKRFYHCYDGLVRDVRMSYVNRKANIILSVQDQYTKDDQGWINLTLEIEDVNKIILIEDRSTCVVLSSGLQIGFFDTLIHLDFNPYSEEPKGIDDFNKSHFLIAGERCTWSVSRYQNMDVLDEQ